ncbi:methylated-DNA--[protein]-cysteine S-methyltransferase [Celerinatantimonas yamalensis]|uniref:Methylated-DNA--protein-cysteine methyltransferase n=1 Tax=Celerinatantimonas yamalensis TaxID=559956 RepID=A0ABW9G3S9_9GAMM
MMYFTHAATLLGDVTIQTCERGISGIWFETQTTLPDDLGRRNDQHPMLVAVILQLNEYLAGKRTRFTLPVVMTGTPFQRSVWQALMTIPFGETRTYQQLANAIGHPRAVRAVGAANGRNPISIIVPCHRVIGSNGKLTGYAGGVERKAALLQLEGVRSMLEKGA